MDGLKITSIYRLPNWLAINPVIRMLSASTQVKRIMSNLYVRHSEMIACTHVIDALMRARDQYSPTCRGKPMGTFHNTSYISTVRVRTAMSNSQANKAGKIVAMVQLTRL